MLKRRLTTAAMIAVSLSGVLVLSACEEHPYPAASQPNEQPAPPPPPAPLAGAPTYAPPPLPAPAPAETAPAPRNDAGSVVAMAPIPNPGSRF